MRQQWPQYWYQFLYSCILSSNFRRCVKCNVFLYAPWNKRSYYAMAMSVHPSFMDFFQHALRYQFETWCVYIYIYIYMARHTQVTLSYYTTKSRSNSFCVCPSVTPFSPCSHHIIMKFSGVITIDQSDVHEKGHDQRSNVKVTEVKTQFNSFRTVIPVCICIWQWNDAQSLMWHRRGVLLFFKVIRQVSRSHRTKKLPIFTRIRCFWPVTPVWIHQWLDKAWSA